MGAALSHKLKQNTTGRARYEAGGIRGTRINKVFPAIGAKEKEPWTNVHALSWGIWDIFPSKLQLDWKNQVMDLMWICSRVLFLADLFYASLVSLARALSLLSFFGQLHFYSQFFPRVIASSHGHNKNRILAQATEYSLRVVGSLDAFLACPLLSAFDAGMIC